MKKKEPTVRWHTKEEVLEAASNLPPAPLGRQSEPHQVSEPIIPMVVTTALKGVFFGYGQPTNEKVVTLKQARMCLYWPASVKGVMGLAVTGPLKGARVSPAVPSFTVQDVTSLMEVTPEAAASWEAGVWS